MSNVSAELGLSSPRRTRASRHHRSPPRRPMPVGKLADRLSVGRPAVSKHLRVLGDAGLVRHESRGTRNLYALAPEGMVAAQQWLVTMWDTALAGYAEAVEAAARRPTPIRPNREAPHDNRSAAASRDHHRRRPRPGLRGLHSRGSASGGRCTNTASTAPAPPWPSSTRVSARRSSSRPPVRPTPSGGRSPAGSPRLRGVHVAPGPGGRGGQPGQRGLRSGRRQDAGAPGTHRWEIFADPVAAREEYDHGWPAVLDAFAGLVATG